MSEPSRIGRGWFVAAAIAFVVAAAIAVAVVFNGGQGPNKKIAASGAAQRLESKARDHLPADCEIAVVVDLGKVLASPNSKSIGAAIDDIARGKGAPSPALREILEKTAVDVRRDVGEVGICGKDLGGARQRVVVIIAGKLLTGAIASNPPIDTASGSKLEVAQVADAAILVSNDAALLAEARDANPARAVAYGFIPGAEANIALSASFLKRSRLVAGPLAQYTGSIEKAVASASIGAPRADAKLTMDDETSATDLGSTIVERLATIGDDTDAGTSLLREALAGATAKTTGKDVVVTLPWSASLAAKLDEKIGKSLAEANARGSLSP